ncbi:hypothetical protein CH380_07840 [Leptospira adleri]|uniref:Uncharacterized protein n=1 Tax=Leptospira adleri TaxID=2023186 RepID=A0A2M9YQT6_9LEPT|nr:hypothetical protein CH380_07840 [Leptospira adleri]PJZ59488.1 hypothetical protein CH376_23490 [Leptospira adleri]
MGRAVRILIEDFSDRDAADHFENGFGVLITKFLKRNHDHKIEPQTIHPEEIFANHRLTDLSRLKR